MRATIDFLRFMYKVAIAYWDAGKKGSCYASVTMRTRYAPKVVIFVARGREAWRVSQLAIECKRIDV